MTFEEFCDALKETGAYQAEDGHIYRKDGSILSRQGRNGYYTLRKMFDNHTYYFMEHRVAYYFAYGKFDEKLQINHKDENKHNNCVDNLEWISRQNNLCYGTRLDRIKSSKDNKLNDKGRNSCEKKLMSVVVKCKDIGMNREKVEDMINKVVNGVFGEE